ncbi:MAG: hypothetical protein US56_C0023G0001, partial [Candidatus Moranbacteria bacterium GW2011_GWF2_37_7]
FSINSIKESSASPLATISTASLFTTSGKYVGCGPPKITVALDNDAFKRPAVLNAQ